MRIIKKNLKILIVLTAVFACPAFVFLPQVHAQQTIINVPSSDVLPAGHIILKESNRFSPFSDGYVNLTPSATIGLGHNMQFSSGVATSLSDKKTIRADLGLKKVWFLGSATRFTLGTSVNPYLNQSHHPDTMIYAHFTQRIKETRTSLTAGAFAGGTRGLPEQAGALIGIDQVIIPNKLRFAMDWMSSNENYGRMGVGLKYRPHPTLSITSAVIIPNKDSENLGFSVSVSKFLALDETNPIKRRLTNVD